MRITCIFLLAMLGMSAMTGCWDNNEPDTFGYVQAVAIDGLGEGRVKVTTHFYNPSSPMGSMEEADASQQGLNIQTSGDTIFEAVRDIPLYFGRKAKWDHMRVILVSEELLRRQNIGEIFDYFSRDHEPRGTVIPIVTQGEAAPYLQIKPFIEQTIGQQFKKMTKNGAEYASKTSKIPLYDLAIQMKSASRVSELPYIQPLGKRAVVAGTAMLRSGKLTTVLGGKDTEGLLMLTNRYKRGSIEFPCTENAVTADQLQRQESFEVQEYKAKVTPYLQEDRVVVKVDIRLRGSVGELRCSSLRALQEVDAYQASIADQIKQRLQTVVGMLQRERLDSLGIGNRIYRRHPALWSKWEDDWERRFAEAEFEIAVHVDVLDTGLNIGFPFGQEEEKER
ncbi:Ger(x)C family spore germination protein [Paenibacillus sp. IB182496]|uniref:Ger(X)C family spore germination protein n=1 Tax=Paenibacillus sabuli TaxID=2772509 RepID=A0A927BVH1_9BACL|nr:Ger(x)C family spore germination protein [Paenibacillus sabuli]MBD2847586.1 Ger(x)C family spore germination protein [Paenibacillus sabuli]